MATSYSVMWCISRSSVYWWTFILFPCLNYLINVVIIISISSHKLAFMSMGEVPNSAIAVLRGSCSLILVDFQIAFCKGWNTSNFWQCIGVCFFLHIHSNKFQSSIQLFPSGPMGEIYLIVTLICISLTNSIFEPFVRHLFT